MWFQNQLVVSQSYIGLTDEDMVLGSVRVLGLVEKVTEIQVNNVVHTDFTQDDITFEVSEMKSLRLNFRFCWLHLNWISQLFSYRNDSLTQSNSKSSKSIHLRNSVKSHASLIICNCNKNMQLKIQSRKYQPDIVSVTTQKLLAAENQRSVEWHENADYSGVDRNNCVQESGLLPGCLDRQQCRLWNERVRVLVKSLHSLAM